MGSSVPSASRLERLLKFLESDPANPSLLGDAAVAAYDAQQPETALALLERHAAVEPLPASLINLKGMIALAQQRYGDAAAEFEALRATGADAPALRFNLAWAKAMTNDWSGALDLLDDETVAATARAPSLKIHALHHLDRYEDALAAGEALAARFPDNHALMGALASLALDAEKQDLALAYARRAGDNAEGRAALGILALGRNDTKDSLVLFEEAIARQPNNPRAWVGKGLGLLAGGNAAAGAEAIDRGAELFGTHLGSWIASGWAHFVNGENAKARASFERALAIDPNFAEGHGGIAVMDIFDGKVEAARRETDIALRLDRKSFGGALAKSMLLDKSGNPDLARRIREIAFDTPVGPDGQTLAQALVSYGSGFKR